MKPKALLAEFIGTFALIFVGCGCIVAAEMAKAPVLVVAAFAHGLTIATMGTALGGVSGGHFNPAVSLGLFLGKQVSFGVVLGYWVAQLLGGAAAAYLVKGLFPVDAGINMNYGALSLNEQITPLMGLILEAIGTFFLVLAVFGTAVDSRAPKVGAWFIGLTLTIMIFAFGPLTGTGINPARWFGPALAVGQLGSALTYVAGPLLGGAVAGLVAPWLLKSEEVTEA